MNCTELTISRLFCVFVHMARTAASNIDGGVDGVGGVNDEIVVDFTPLSPMYSFRPSLDANLQSIPIIPVFSQGIFRS